MSWEQTLVALLVGVIGTAGVGGLVTAVLQMTRPARLRRHAEALAAVRELLPEGEAPPGEPRRGSRSEGVEARGDSSQRQPGDLVLYGRMIRVTLGSFAASYFGGAVFLFGYAVVNFGENPWASVGAIALGIVMAGVGVGFLNAKRRLPAMLIPAARARP